MTDLTQAYVASDNPRVKGMIFDAAYPIQSPEIIQHLQKVMFIIQRQWKEVWMHRVVSDIRAYLKTNRTSPLPSSVPFFTKNEAEELMSLVDEMYKDAKPEIALAIKTMDFSELVTMFRTQASALVMRETMEYDSKPRIETPFNNTDGSPILLDAVGQPITR